MRLSHSKIKNKSKVLRLVVNIPSQSHAELRWNPQKAQGICWWGCVWWVLFLGERVQLLEVVSKGVKLLGFAQPSQGGWPPLFHCQSLKILAPMAELKGRGRTSCVPTELRS